MNEASMIMCKCGHLASNAYPGSQKGGAEDAEGADDMRRSHALQSMLHDIVNLFVRDYITTWYAPLTDGDAALGAKAAALTMHMVDQLHAVCAPSCWPC